jgi:aspartate aminotransferase
VLYDLMYGSLLFEGLEHPHPLAMVPEAAPWLVIVDGISKAFAATGLRVGWALGAPAVIARLKDFLGHVGAWAPRPEQVATAAFLRDSAAIETFRATMTAALLARLDALHSGFNALRDEGYPVDCVRPQGAMYLSLRLDLAGRSVGGVTIADNEAIRKLLLERAGVAVVPFQAFGLSGESGWFRLSAGAVSLEDIRGAMPRVRSLLEGVTT